MESALNFALKNVLFINSETFSRISIVELVNLKMLDFGKLTVK